VNLATVSRTIALAVGISAPGIAPHINIRIVNMGEAPPEVIAHAQDIVADIS
jgi:hypothetical protein